MKVNNILCIYHDDLDGYCSAAIVNHFYSGDIEAKKINHGEANFLNDLKGYNIIFVDFTPSVEYLETLSANNKKILILDHHKTAMDRFEIIEKNTYKNVSMELDLSKAGCGVVWNHFFGDGKNEIKPSSRPFVINLVEDYDIWKWEYDETENFVNGMEIWGEKNNPLSNLWSSLIENDKELMKTIIHDGITITIYKQLYNEQLLKELSYEAIFGEHKILVCNAPKNNSKLFGSRIKDYPFVAMYSHKNGQYLVSLYSDSGFDTTTISTTMVDKNGNRGGGHPGASGFRCEELPWKEVK